MTETTSTSDGNVWEPERTFEGSLDNLKIEKNKYSLGIEVLVSQDYFSKVQSIQSSLRAFDGIDQLVISDDPVLDLVSHLSQVTVSIEVEKPGVSLMESDDNTVSLDTTTI